MVPIALSCSAPFVMRWSHFPLQSSKQKLIQTTQHIWPTQYSTSDCQLLLSPRLAIFALQKGGDTVNLEAKAGSPLARSHSTVMGKPYAAELSWKDVGCAVLDTKTMTQKTVLSGCTGTALPGETVALMGPSGAGCTDPIPSSAPISQTFLTLESRHVPSDTKS
jgi:ABC-type multidrug transport system fused ATPase/permease subunit